MHIIKIVEMQAKLGELFEDNDCSPLEALLAMAGAITIMSSIGDKKFLIDKELLNKALLELQKMNKFYE